MFRRPTNAKSMFSMSGNNKKKSDPMPVFETQNAPVPVIRQDVDAAFTMGQSKKYLRSSGLEK